MEREAPNMVQVSVRYEDRLLEDRALCPQRAGSGWVQEGL